MPISISSGPSSKVGVPAAGTMHGVSAMPKLRLAWLARRPIAATSSRSAPVAASAPETFSTTTVPPVPRRPAV